MEYCPTKVAFNSNVPIFNGLPPVVISSLCTVFIVFFSCIAYATAKLEHLLEYVMKFRYNE